MTNLTANELKIRGVSAIEEALVNDNEAIVSVRGKPLGDSWRNLPKLMLSGLASQTERPVAGSRNVLHIGFHSKL